MADRILWNGKFLDGTITFILPEVPVVCPESHTIDYDNVAVLFVVKSKDTEFVNHIHVEVPVELTFAAHLPELLVAIQKDYLHLVMETRDHAAHLH